MAYRPNIKNADGTLTDLPIAAETAVLADKAKLLANMRSIGLSGVTATAKVFNGASNAIIPITAIPSSLLTGTLANDRLPIAGVKIGGVRNGGNITVSSDGTLDYNGTDARNITVIAREGLGNYTNLEDVLNYISLKLPK